MPVAIHTGDPKAFWQPPGPKNERYDELKAHPEWSFYGEPVPSWEQLYQSFERRVARHPKTTFIGVHFGNDPEDPDQVARMLDKYPNLYIDTAARVPEIGRHDRGQDAALLREVPGSGAVRHRHRHRRQPGRDDVRLQRRRSRPPRRTRSCSSAATYRYFETRDRQFPHPTPIQGRWSIDGVGLSEAILRKIYFENAARAPRLSAPRRAARGRRSPSTPTRPLDCWPLTPIMARPTFRSSSVGRAGGC